MSPDQERPEALRDVEPAEPLASWLGGKRNLARRIIARIEAVPHACYAEPFCGMAGVFLRRTRRPKKVRKNVAVNSMQPDGEAAPLISAASTG